MHASRYGVLALLLALSALPPALAQSAPAAVDAAFPGTILLSVDLRDTAHRIFRVKETIPASPGPLVLSYPKWIPGEHGPTGTIDGVTGLVITADAQALPWRRDPVDMYSVRVEVPPGARAVDVAFQFLSPPPGRNFGAGASATPTLTVLEWNQVVFYPAGYGARQITLQPNIALPAGWDWATALESSSASDKGIAFAPVSLETLVDSPLMAGRYVRKITLSSDPVPVRLDIVADRPEYLAANSAQVLQHERIVREAAALFGAHHYGHYDFLFALSEHTAHFGLEHHQSSDNRAGAEYFTDRDAYFVDAGLLPHEYVHSWNGKYRRPAGLLTPSYATPMKSELLWVYEGLTEYWGDVLTARSGLYTPEQYRDFLADSAAALEFTPGRTWRPLQDTADQAQVLYQTGSAWRNWRRGADFYAEGELIWLDVDTLIMELSHGERSLDDFARVFFGRDDGQFEPRPYTFDDVVAALDKVQHYDWAHFLRARLDARAPGAPIDGLVRSGWKLTYNDEANAYEAANAKQRKRLNLLTGLGIVVNLADGADTLVDVLWQGPAFEAGLAPGMKLVAVNGERFTPEVLTGAIKAAQSGTAPIELLVQDTDQFRTVKVDYHGGLRHPHLVRIEGSDERLGAVIKARAR